MSTMSTPQGWQIDVPASLASRDARFKALSEDYNVLKDKHDFLQQRLCKGTALALNAEKEALIAEKEALVAEKEALVATHASEITGLATKAKYVNASLAAHSTALQSEVDALTERNKVLVGVDQTHSDTISKWKAFETQAIAAHMRSDEAHKRYKRKFIDVSNALDEARNALDEERTANAPLKLEVADLSTALAAQKRATADADGRLYEASAADAMREGAIDDLRTQVDAARANVANAMAEGSSLALKLSEATATISSLHDRLNRELAGAQHKIDELQAKIDESQAKFDELQAKFEESQVKFEESQVKFEKSQVKQAVAAPKRKRSAPSRFSPE